MIVRCHDSSGVNNLFKWHLLLNHMVNCKQTLQKWSMDGTLSKLFKKLNSISKQEKTLKIFLKETTRHYELRYVVYSIIKWTSNKIVQIMAPGSILALAGGGGGVICYCDCPVSVVVNNTFKQHLLNHITNCKQT